MDDREARFGKDLMDAFDPALPGGEHEVAVKAPLPRLALPLAAAAALALAFLLLRAGGGLPADPGTGDDGIRIAVLGGGRYRVEGAEVGAEELAARVRAARRGPVRIENAGGPKWDEVARAIDACCAAGLRDVTVAASAPPPGGGTLRVVLAGGAGDGVAIDGRAPVSFGEALDLISARPGLTAVRITAGPEVPRGRLLLLFRVCAGAGANVALVPAPAAGDLAGRVTGTDGKPLAARVLGVVKSWPGGQFRMEPIATDAGEDGRYRFEGVCPAEGRYDLFVVAFAGDRAFRSAYVSVPGGPAPELSLELPPAHPVTLRFADGEGRPVTGLSVIPSRRKTAEGVEHLVYGIAVAPYAARTDEKGELSTEWFEKGDEAAVSFLPPGGPDWVPHSFPVKGVRGETVEVRVDAAPAPAADDVADVPAEDLRIGDDPMKRYFLIGPAGEAKKPPKGGFPLLLVLPGGDGSEAFHPFVKRIVKNALGEGWLAAELVAPKWTPDQEIVWPKDGDGVSGAKFTTTEFIEAVVADVRKRRKGQVDADRVYALGWSSSGPALYAAALEKRTPVAGWFVAMSVFHPTRLPDLGRAKGRRFYLYHSPNDAVCPFPQAEEAKEKLTKAGAKVELVTYPGGHGWRGDVFGSIRAGVEWLQD